MLTFIILADGYGHLQCCLEAGNLMKSHDALLFAQCTSLAMYGEMKKIPPDQSALDDRELLVDYYKVVESSPSDMESLTSRISNQQNQWYYFMLDNRHPVLRGDTESPLMKVKAAIGLTFIQTHTKMHFTKILPPKIIMDQVEGGSRLFKVPYYESTAYLTQSSQLYLETVLSKPR